MTTFMKVVGWCPYHKRFGWRVDLAGADQQVATSHAMRSIESAAQQGWEIRPLFAETSED